VNTISSDKFEKADDLFQAGASLREVVRKVGIAKGTAERIQKLGKIIEVKNDGKTRINTGRRKDGSLSFYFTSELRESWNRQHYGKPDDF